MTAGAVWDGAGILQANTGLPADLATLRNYLLSSGTKAEQEGWL